MSRRDLAPLVAALGPRVFALHVGRMGRMYQAHLELARQPRSAESAIREFVGIIDRLPRSARASWTHAVHRDFNIGVQAGMKPHDSEFSVHPTVLRDAARLGARLVFTVYAPIRTASGPRVRSGQPPPRQTVDRSRPSDLRRSKRLPFSAHWARMRPSVVGHFDYAAIPRLRRALKEVVCCADRPFISVSDSLFPPSLFPGAEPLYSKSGGQRLFDTRERGESDTAGLAALGRAGVRPDFQVLAGIARMAAAGYRDQTLELNLSEELALEASIEGVEFHAHNRYVLTGSLRGARAGTVVLAVDGEALAARIFLGATSLAILPDGDGGHNVFEIEQVESAARSERDPAAPPDVQADFVNPSVDLTMSASSYSEGDTITISSLEIKNPNASSTRVRLKLWLKIPRWGEITLIDTDLWGYLQLPPNLDIDLGPIRLIRVYSFFPPKGDYEANIRLSSPDKTVVYTEDLNAFTVQ